VKRILVGLGVTVLVLLVAAIAGLLVLHIPQNAAGVVAETVCDAAFVSGRDKPADQLVASDVTPQSPVLGVVSASIDRDQHTVTAKFLGVIPRTAALETGKGCVLDGDTDATATPYVPAAPNPAAWPKGDAPVAAGELGGLGVDSAKLSSVLDSAFADSGDPNGVNARGVAVVQGGKLLVLRDGQGIAPNTALHGWSMTKTVTAMLAWKKFSEIGLDINEPVVAAFPAGRAPSWVAEWQNDDRKKITVADLLFMRDGLKIDEGYGPTGDVVQMLYGERDMSAWSAQHPLEFAPGSTWEYLSATANILSAVTRAQFASDADYLAYARTALFVPIGVTTATLQPDASGTWVGSSYLWASTADWARLGQLMLHDGSWDGTQVIPTGWRALAATPAVPSGEGHGYGAQTWLPGEPVGGECASTPGYPKDTLLMEGHWGQIVAMVPSKDAVIVRLGWSIDTDFDGCRFVADVAATLPASST
jgi:CubicO group peptidase (beta-lactamase class C family)